MLGGIMSSPAIEAAVQTPIHRRVFEDISNREAILTPDDSPVRKRQRHVELASSPVSNFKLSNNRIKGSFSVYEDDADEEEEETNSSRNLARNLFSTATTTSYDRFRWKYARGESMLWCSPAHSMTNLTDLHTTFSDNATPASCRPFCVSLMHHRDIAAVGLQGGHIVFTKGRETQSEEKMLQENAMDPIFQCQRPQERFRDAVLSMDICPNDTLLAAGSTNSFRVCDVETGKWVIDCNTEERCRIKHIEFCPESPALLATGDSAGTLSLYDLRENKRVAHYYNIFDNRRRDLAITGMTWIKDRRLAAGCESHSSVQVWDLRKPTPYGTKNWRKFGSAPENQKRQFGITSIKYDESDNKIWAMSRDSHVYSYHASNPAAGVVDTLSAPELNVGSFHNKISLVRGGQRTVNDYIACGGGVDGSVVVFAKPSSSRLEKQSIGKATALLRNGHQREVTDVSAQNGTIATISDDAVMRFWQVDGALAKKLSMEPTVNTGWAEAPYERE